MCNEQNVNWKTIKKQNKTNQTICYKQHVQELRSLLKKQGYRGKDIDRILMMLTRSASIIFHNMKIKLLTKDTHSVEIPWKLDKFNNLSAREKNRKRCTFPKNFLEPLVLVFHRPKSRKHLLVTAGWFYSSGIVSVITSKWCGSKRCPTCKSKY